MGDGRYLEPACEGETIEPCLAGPTFQGGRRCPLSGTGIPGCAGPPFSGPWCGAPWRLWSSFASKEAAEMRGRQQEIGLPLTIKAGQIKKKKDSSLDMSRTGNWIVLVQRML